MHSEITDSILGSFYAVYNESRYGYLEAVYSSALEVEFRRRQVSYVREMSLDVIYKGNIVGMYRADFLVAGRVVVEVKGTRQLGDADRRQLLNYLRTTRTEVGLILHFGPKAEFHRMVFTHSEQSA
ncbi:MAG: GxxExxY protein [Gemmatimonadota bacterium]|nr:GxxExxY protein [Gemmatimonadota bacterium]